MPRFILPCFIALTLALVAGGCKKNGSSREAIFYGTWTKGANAGDTLWFFQRSGKDWVRYSMSFNPGMPVYEENEFQYKNGKLAIKNYLGMGAGFYTLHSFSWKQPGKAFDIQGAELYIFMSSTMVHYTFTKVQ